MGGVPGAMGGCIALQVRWVGADHLLQGLIWRHSLSAAGAPQGGLHNDEAPEQDLKDGNEPRGSRGRVSGWPPQYGVGYTVLRPLLVIYLRFKYNYFYLLTLATLHLIHGLLC